MPSDISLTSSRNIVPRSARRNLPSFRRSAPVKEPFSWPKSSDSSSVSVMAAQLMRMKGPLLRGLLV